MRKTLIYFLLISSAIPSLAQDIVLKANYPPVVTAGEQFAISWNVNAGGAKFFEPPFTGFYKLMGPQTSFSSSTQIVNGKFSQTESYTYTFFLQAVNEGRFVIEPAAVTIKNKEYRSDSIYIEVISDQSSAQPVQKGRQQQEAAGDQGDAAAAGSDLFIRLNISRTEVFQGEHLIATIKVYSRVDNLAGINEIKSPDFKGFLTEMLETPQLRSLQRENIGGTIYGTGVVQQYLLYPQMTGDVVIDPVEMTVLLQERLGNSDPFFGDFFAQYRNVPKMLMSKPVTVKVKPLPPNRPEDFSGVTGKIDLKAGISRDTVNVNDALNLKITISGSGNLRIAGNPKIKLPPDVEVYEPEITDNIRNSPGGTNGQKTFEYVLIPRHYGDFRIPPVTYSFFNPATGKYETLSTGEFVFHARKGTDAGGGVTVYGGVTKEDVKYLGKDIRFIKNEPGRLERSHTPIVSKRSFYAFYALALAVFIAVLIIRREHVRRNSDIASVRNRKAGRIARKRLAEASKCLKSGMLDRFHEEILKALWGYLSDKLGIPQSALTRVSAFEALKERRTDEEIISRLSEILDKCEFARFAPASSGAEASEIYSGALDVIKSIENNR